MCSALGWIAAVVSLNEKRTGPRYDQAEIFKVTTSDGEQFLVGILMYSSTHTHRENSSLLVNLMLQTVFLYCESKCFNRMDNHALTIALK